MYLLKATPTPWRQSRPRPRPLTAVAAAAPAARRPSLATTPVGAPAHDEGAGALPGDDLDPEDAQRQPAKPQRGDVVAPTHEHAPAVDERRHSHDPCPARVVQTKAKPPPIHARCLNGPWRR